MVLCLNLCKKCHISYLNPSLTPGLWFCILNLCVWSEVWPGLPHSADEMRNTGAVDAEDVVILLFVLGFDKKLLIGLVNNPTCILYLKLSLKNKYIHIHLLRDLQNTWNLDLWINLFFAYLMFTFNNHFCKIFSQILYRKVISALVHDIKPCKIASQSNY